MAKELIINASLPEVRIALMEDGRIQELLIERDSEKGIVGNIYKGRVTRVLPGMQAAFVDVGLDKAAFLYVDDIFVHPKVMGDDAEMIEEEYEEESSEGASSEGSSEEPKAPVVRPSGSFVSTHASADQVQATKAQFQDEAAALEEAHEHEIVASEIASEIDSSQLECHTADHAETELTTDEMAHEFDEAAHEDSSDDSSEIEFSSEVSTEEDFSDEEDSEEDSEEDEDDQNDEESMGFSDENDQDDEGSDDQGSEENFEGEAMSASAEGSNENNGEENQSQPQLNADGTVVEGTGDASLQGLVQGQGKGRRFRNRNRNRRRGKGKGDRDQKTEGSKPARNQFAAGESHVDPDLMPDTLSAALYEKGDVESDRSAMEGENKPVSTQARPKSQRPEFREQRNRDRRIKTKHARPRAQANIADLLKEGQEVIVQVAKDPIATKGARLTCHVSLPGRHLVCMPTIDHVGVSRRIERDDERRRLRDFVEKNRTKKLGFIVRTASGGKDPESWIKQDIDYLTKLWGKICNRADEVSAPSIVYEDLNSVLRSIRDWVNEDIDKIIVDTRYHYNELLDFAERFMPSLIGKIELYQGDIPVFDAYGLSSELYRSLERRVWLKSGGYIVIDQAEALVAIDVNTGRFVGKKNLEDTILKTNIEAAEEIAYQLRLRNCGGIIICDFIDMERDENRMRVYRALEEALRKDRARPTIQKISELGLVEMTRKRTRDTIIRTLCEPCSHCEGKGFGKSKLTVAYEILRETERLGIDREAKKILISAHESVIDILAIDLRDALDTLERRYNKTVYLQAILDFHNEQYEVVTDRTVGKKQNQDIARQLRIERDRSERKEKQKQRQKEVASHRNDSDDEESPAEVREERQERSGGRDRNRDRNRGRDRNQNQNQNHERTVDASAESTEPAVAEAPKPRPEGQFVARPKPVIEAKPVVEGEEAQSNPEGQEEFSAEESFPTSERVATGYEDEDQLAYLRAQAAQDAALARGATSSQAAHTGGGGGGQNRNNRNNRGGRNQNNRQGRNQNRGNNDRGAGRFRQQQRTAGGQVTGAQESPRANQTADHEVGSSTDGDFNS
jgi:Rne/Rng family ribonuclease